MKKFTSDEIAIMNFTLKTLHSNIEQALIEIPDGTDITQEVRTLKTIENLLEKINI